jgi:hypothetical protein
MDSQVIIDVQTVNVIIKLLTEEIKKYKPESDASIALMILLERLSNL